MNGFKVTMRPHALLSMALATVAGLAGQDAAKDVIERASLRATTEEVVHVRTSDGITNAGAIFAPSRSPAERVAIIWLHGSTENFYYPSYLKIARELAARGFTTISGNTRMHDLGSVVGTRGDTRLRGGVYWGKYSEQVHDLAAWIDFAGSRGFQSVILAGHSAGTTAVQIYQAQRQDARVAGLVLASGRFRPGAAPDPERLARAKKMVEEGLGEAMLPYPNRPTAFVSAATFLDLANLGPLLRDFWGVETPDPPVARIRCPILAWFGTKEAEVGTAADLELLKSSVQRLTEGPRRVDTAMIQNAGHMYVGEESQVAQTIVRWATEVLQAGGRKDETRQNGK